MTYEKIKSHIGDLFRLKRKLVWYDSKRSINSGNIFMLLNVITSHEHLKQNWSADATTFPTSENNTELEKIDAISISIVLNGETINILTKFENIELL